MEGHCDLCVEEEVVIESLYVYKYYEHNVKSNIITMSPFI